jgi:hypothetical protein
MGVTETPQVTEILSNLAVDAPHYAISIIRSSQTIMRTIWTVNFKGRLGCGNAKAQKSHAQRSDNAAATNNDIRRNKTEVMFRAPS